MIDGDGVKRVGKVVVYCASSDEVDENYLEAAELLGAYLAKNNIEVVYGGGKVGLMGRLAKGAIETGGKVTGIIPEFMIPLELGNSDITELITVKDMHQRQAMMMEKSDAAIVLPGGSGTMLEFLEIISWKRLGLLISPVILVNLYGYYDELIRMLEKSINSGFMSKEYINLWRTCDTIEFAIDTLNAMFSR